MSAPTALRLLETRALQYLRALVAFDTTSRNSNLPLIEYIEGQLALPGVRVSRIPNGVGDKANLLVTIGPHAAGGIVLSGHTDVVPVHGQAWSTDPFVLTERDGRLYGRGTSDMKSFVALAMALTAEMTTRSLIRPVHLAFTYDEEVGCLGAPSLIEHLLRELHHPAAVIVGEPTSMRVVSGHKGVCVYRIRVVGHEAHSSLTHLGVSAIEVALDLIAKLRGIAARLVVEADLNSPFVPPNTTLTIGQIAGGTAANILARECTFVFDLRCSPGVVAADILAPFLSAAAAADAELRSRFSEAGVWAEQLADAPALSPELDGAAEHLARRVGGDNGEAGAVAYAAEAGQFQKAGISTVLCGPGSIEQAHQPNEFIEIAQLKQGTKFMARLCDVLTGTEPMVSEASG